MGFLDWIASLGEPFRALVVEVYAFFPKLVAAFAVVVVGWLAARLVRFLTLKLVGRVQVLVPGRSSPDDVSNVERVVVRSVGLLSFWVVLLVAIGVAVEILGLESATTALAELTRYLPRLIGAGLVMVGGVILGNITASWMSAEGRAVGFVYAEAMAKAARTLILLLASVIALAQAGIDSTLLVVAAATVLAAFLGAVALAFGLGSRITVSNLIASHYLQRTYRVGQSVRIGEHIGRLVEFRPTGAVIDTEAGVAFVPAKEFQEHASVLVSKEL